MAMRIVPDSVDASFDETRESGVGHYMMARATQSAQQWFGFTWDGLERKFNVTFWPF